MANAQLIMGDGVYYAKPIREGLQTSLERVAASNGLDVMVQVTLINVLPFVVCEFFTDSDTDVLENNPRLQGQMLRLSEELIEEVKRYLRNY